MEKKTRDSGLELLRIISLLLIFWMHGASSYADNEISAWLCIAIETVGNIGVTVFILISGYFGVTYRPQRLLRLEVMLVFYCWIGLFLRYLWGVLPQMGGEEILSYVFPVIGRNSWYFTCYFALVLLSPFLNCFLEKLDRDVFRRMLVVMLVIFSGITTFFFFDITQDGGKGIVNMVLVYFLGRYIGMYHRGTVYRRGRLAALYVALTAVCFALNGALYLATGVMQNRFARDNTLFTIFESVCIFLIFKDIHFESRAVNRIASCVPAAFTMEWTLRGAITQYLFDYLAWRESNWHEWILLGISVLLIAAGTAIELLRVALFAKIEARLADGICHALSGAARRPAAVLAGWMEKLGKD